MSTAALKVASRDTVSTPSTEPQPLPKSNRQRLLAYLAPHKGILTTGLLCGALASLVEGGTGFLFKKFIDNLGNSAQSKFLVWICVGIVALYILLGVFKYGQTILLATAAQRVGQGIRRDIYAHLQKFSLGYFHRRRTGAIMSTLQSDAAKVQNAAMLLKDAVNAPLAVGIFLGMLFAESWLLTCFLLLAVPGMAIAIQTLTRRLRGLSQATQERLGNMSAMMEETISAPRIVRAFSAEEREIARFENASEEAVKAQLRSTSRSARLGPVVDVLGAIGVAGVLYIGGMLVHDEVMTVGSLSAYLFFAAKISANVNAIGGIKSNYEDMMGAADRIFADVLDVQPEINDVRDAKVLPTVSGRIAFENVSFAYSPETPVLTDISLIIEPGQVVAFVGETGAGKSTLADLVPRFYDPTAGRITVDGHDIRCVAMASLRRQIGIVPQESVLFSGTLRDNLIYGRPEATDDEVRSAARVTNIADFIEALPDGYETRVGERGSTLSGGQRQRVAIARALLADPRILILDEATSALDTKTEASVKAALDTLLKGRTTLIIAHRLSTIQNADKIVVLSQGRIAETGTHSDLLNRDGIYARLYATQAKQKE
ncbi:MAG: ABC transporter ATP-binding protein, partial [Akkermansiaceae bacterium]|nr:ABC transporter ATP-binding protein [Armatimonadota bacterium]